MLEEATKPQNNPVHMNAMFQAEGGAATGAVVAFEKRSDSLFILHGASIGDAAVISVHRDGRARQLNPVFRKHERDTGGQLTMCMGVDGPVWAFAAEIGVDELVILATDGFTDNISHEELDRLVPLVVCARIFDTIVQSDCDIVVANSPSQPTWEYLRRIAVELDDFSVVECEVAARRLFNYVEWVTRAHHRQEQEYYLKCLQLRAAGPGSPIGIELDREVSQLMAERKASRKVVKTDDAMIVVMRPSHR
jgi:hypothetical protein